MTVQPEQSQFGGMRSTRARIAPHVALELGPFAEAAVRYARVGLAVVPCGGSDGKVPRIRTRTMKRGLSLAAIGRRMPSWGSSNVGILTGTRSGVTIIDIDDSQLVPEMIERFGSTPLVPAAAPTSGIDMLASLTRILGMRAWL